MTTSRAHGVPPIRVRIALARDWDVSALRHRPYGSPAAFLERTLAGAVLADLEAEEDAELDRWTARADAAVGVLAQAARLVVFFLVCIGLLVLLGHDGGHAVSTAALLALGHIAVGAWLAVIASTENWR